MLLLKPTTPKERIEMVDALRGFALTGVCLANLGMFSFYSYLSNEQKADLPLPVVNSIISYLIYFFVDQKFWTLFSIMFGFGASIFISRANEAHKNGKILYARRLMILLVFGLFHHIFLWNGDILVDYALAGFLLLLFCKKTSASLAVWGIILGTFVTMGIKILQMKLLPHTQEQILKLDPMIMNAYSSDSYSRIITANLADLKMYYIYVFYALLASLGRFMVGFWIGQSGRINNIEKYTVFLKKALRVCALVGFPVMTLITINKILLDLGILAPEFNWKFIKYLLLIGSMPIGIFYAIKFSLLYQNIKWKKRLSVFKEMGRMAFTNYLMQTVLNIFIFNGIGFGLAGKTGPSIYILWFIVLIAGQIIFSRWWLTRYRFGPVEWLWRSLTYMKWQHMIK